MANVLMLNGPLKGQIVNVRDNEDYLVRGDKGGTLTYVKYPYYYEGLWFMAGWVLGTHSRNEDGSKHTLSLQEIFNKYKESTSFRLEDIQDAKTTYIPS